MLKFLPEGIQGYAEGITEAEPALLAELSRVTQEKTEYPEMKISWYEAAVIRLLLKMIGAKRVLEIGTFTGYSALAMAEVLPEDGTVTTCDLDPKNTEIAKSFWARSPAGKKITLKLGAAASRTKSASAVAIVQRNSAGGLMLTRLPSVIRTASSRTISLPPHTPGPTTVGRRSTSALSASLIWQSDGSGLSS